MDWLNIHASTLDSPQFIGSDPVERSTWLCLLRFCIGQENGGVIEDCADWQDRRWQQLARVTKREIARKCELWSFDGDKLVVWAYPVSKQDEVQAKRKAGLDTAAKRWKKHDSSATSLATCSADAEGERKENGKEVRAKPLVLTELPELPEPMRTPRLVQAWGNWIAFRASLGKKKAVTAFGASQSFKDFATWGEDAAIASIENSIRNGWQGLFEPTARAVKSPEPALPVVAPKIRIPDNLRPDYTR